jgi:Protein of unknown function (DUF2934)
VLTFLLLAQAKILSGFRSEVMPKAPRDKDAASPTPKKRTRKTAAPSNGNGVHAESGNGAVKTSVTVAPESTPVTATPATPVSAVAEAKSRAEVRLSLEEQIRLRAYHLYLQRGGRGGSPEQDWLRAKEEICGRQTAV